MIVKTQNQKRLGDNGPPPFLTKTYDMVEDPATNDFISWSPSETSFIIWKPSEFARDILPKYFKHSNLSSFVRQLNIYGFRKTHPDMWEFSHEKFVRGRQDLLKEISRRKQHATQNPLASNVGATVEIGNYGVVDQVDRLKRDKVVLVLELVRQRQAQSNMQNRIQHLASELAEWKRKQQQTQETVEKVIGFLGALFSKASLEPAALPTRKKRRKPADTGNQEPAPSTPDAMNPDHSPVPSTASGHDQQLQISQQVASNASLLRGLYSENVEHLLQELVQLSARSQAERSSLVPLHHEFGEDHEDGFLDDLEELPSLSLQEVDDDADASDPIGSAVDSHAAGTPHTLKSTGIRVPPVASMDLTRGVPTPSTSGSNSTVSWPQFLSAPLSPLYDEIEESLANAGADTFPLPPPSLGSASTVPQHAPLDVDQFLLDSFDSKEDDDPGTLADLTEELEMMLNGSTDHMSNLTFNLKAEPRSPHHVPPLPSPATSSPSPPLSPDELAAAIPQTVVAPGTVFPAGVPGTAGTTPIYSRLLSASQSGSMGVPMYGDMQHQLCNTAPHHITTDDASQVW